MTATPEPVRPAPGLEYGRPQGPEDLAAYARALAWSFRIPEAEAPPLVERLGERVRVLRVDGRTVGGLTVYPAGQWFGGRRVPMAGIGLVAIAPEARGRGTGTGLMNACVLQARAEGHVISTLYPAKQSLYRRAGWELGGGCWDITVPASALDVGTRDLPVRPFGESDLPAVQALHRRLGATRPGEVDRCDYLWMRVTSHWKLELRGFVVEGDSGIEGYAFLHETEAEGFGYGLAATDLLAATPAAALRLLRLLGDHATLAREVTWAGDPSDPVLGLLPEQGWKKKSRFEWMVRLLDVPAALEARGYPAGIEREIPLEIEDPLVPENAGRWVLEVADGRGSVRPGGPGGVRADVRGLATVWAGYTTPAGARMMGLLDGKDEDLERMRQVFAGASPWMSIMF
jgi:predicted acetyltransferase